MRTRHRGRRGCFIKTERFDSKVERRKPKLSLRSQLAADRSPKKILRDNSQTYIGRRRGRPRLSSKGKISSSSSQMLSYTPEYKRGRSSGVSCSKFRARSPNNSSYTIRRTGVHVGEKSHVLRMVDAETALSGPQSYRRPSLNNDKTMEETRLLDSKQRKSTRGRPPKRLLSRSRCSSASLTSPSSPLFTRRKRGRPLSTRAGFSRSKRRCNSIDELEVSFDSLEYSRYLNMTVDVDNLPIEKVLYRNNDLRFGCTDESLQKLLDEVNMHGSVPQLHCPTNFHNHNRFDDSKLISVDTQFVFSHPIVSKVFQDMWSESDNLLNLKSKDVFLALNGLLRPGVHEVWRRRREEQNRQLTRGLLGRLRPNPRPRRYSDMIVPNILVQENGVISSGSLDNNLNGEKLRSGSMSVAVAAARLTAAKSLIRARSHIARKHPLCLQKSKRIRSTSKVNTESFLSRRKRGRSDRRSQNALAVTTSAKTSRRPDVSHHIDWKFCYSSVNKDVESVPLSDQVSRRRRKHNSPTSVSVSDNVDELKGHGVSDSDELTHVIIDSTKSSHETGKVEKESMSSDMFSSLNTDEIFLSADRQAEGRRRRKHALTFQRKLSNNRSIKTFTSAYGLFLGVDKTVRRPDEENSDSPSSSLSRKTDNEPRGSLSKDWQRIHIKNSRNITRSPNRITDRSPSNCTEMHRKPRSMAKQSFSVSESRPRRPSFRLSQQRTSRRPDRMCQLTLLDRLILGLNCSVSQCDDEIHIKQLHADELNILTQRMNRTGFFIQSLALKTNANNDQEYNLVLTFSPSVEISTKRMRVGSSNRAKYDESDNNHIRFSSSEHRTISRTKYTCGPFSHNRTSIFKPNQPSSERGYLSDSSPSKHNKKPSRKLDNREVYSDSEILQTAHKTSSEKLCRKDLHGDKSSTAIRNYQNLSLKSIKSGHGSSSSSFDYSSQFAQHADLNSRGISSAKLSQDTKQAVSTVSPLVSQSLSKRSSRVTSSDIQTTSSFRRHSPRKVIRKVYTGSLTVPKILNRKRPTGSIQASVNSPGCSSSVHAPNVSFASTVMTSAVPYNNLQSTTNVPGSTVFDEPSTMSAIYHHTSFPLQYRPASTSLPSLSNLQVSSIQLPTIVTASTIHAEELKSNQFRIRSTSPMQTTTSVPSPINPAHILQTFVPTTSASTNVSHPEDSGVSQGTILITEKTNIEPIHDVRANCEDVQPSSKEISIVNENIDKFASALPSESSLTMEPGSPVNELDDSHTPANSLSASQLLRLKKVQDDSSSPMHTQNSEQLEANSISNRTTESPSRATKPESGRQSTPGTYSLSKQNQQQSSTHVSTIPSTVCDPCPLPSSMSNHLPFEPVKANPKDEGNQVNPDREVIRDDSHSPMFNNDSISRATLARMSPSLPAPFGLPKPSPHWSSIRPVYPSPQSTFYSSQLIPHSVHVMRDVPATQHSIPVEYIAPNQVATRVVVQTPTNRPSTETNGFPTAILNDYQPSLDPMGSVQYTPGLPFIPGQCKRTVVHKYHSFRKILPKSQDNLGSFLSGLPTSCATSINMRPFNQSPRLTQLPVIQSGVFKGGMISQRTQPLSESSHFAEDYPSNLTFSEHSTRPLDIEVPPNPASQLLKSLLERSDSRDSSVSQSSSGIITTTPQQLPTVVTCSGATTIQSSTHQSRGTWQLGKRASTTPKTQGDVIVTPQNVCSQAVSTPRSSDLTPSREPRRTFASALPASIRLLPGSTSRLQQLGQHYQRRQQMQQQRQASQLRHLQQTEQANEPQVDAQKPDSESTGT